ncbi:HlyD family secretion protein [Bradyrhizobium sp. CNPSo 4010]|uniref:HlyD family secretion protein n=2 Tax=Bradyrhizobium agreste TaxID=2751811 RepID=A0ABS0PJT4_9BRAD|nr:HlyD family secretion protein [Bradyrhizobium agreste]
MAIVAIAWTVAAYWPRWTGAYRYQSTDDAYVAGDVTPLAAKVSGYVKSVAVDDYQHVRRGDLVVEIDPSDFQAQLDLAEANVAAANAAQAQIASRRAIQLTLIRQAEANIRASQAELARASAEARRQTSLLQTQIAGTEQRVEQANAEALKAEAAVLLNRAQLDQQTALLSQLDVEEKQLMAQTAAAHAQADLARNNLGYTRILSPSDGMVAARQVRPGQFIGVGNQVITVVPLPNVWVIANLKETQMARVRAGNTARVTVDAFPSLVMKGRVESWSPATGSTFALLPPDNATGNFTKVVQRVPVKITLAPDPALGSLIRPGMSVIATIDTASDAEPDASHEGGRPR